MAFSDKPEIPRAMVDHDMKNPTTLRHLRTSNRDDAQSEAACFQKRLAATIIRDFQSAVRLVRDHFPRYLDRLSGDQLFRIGVAFFQQADLEKARYCLELAAGKEGSWQHKAMLLVSRTYEAVGNDQRAITVIQDLLDQQPEKTFRRQALKRLMTLQSQGGNPLSMTDTV
jgi:tetratricopeptide (TPR) repeat protein